MNVLLIIIITTIKKQLTSIENLLHAKRCSKHVTCIICQSFQQPYDVGIINMTAAAAAAAKSLQSCPTLCDPTDGSPPGSPVPGILQARVLEWGAIAFSD